MKQPPVKASFCLCSSSLSMLNNNSQTLNAQHYHYQYLVFFNVDMNKPVLERIQFVHLFLFLQTCQISPPRWADKWWSQQSGSMFSRSASSYLFLILFSFQCSFFKLNLLIFLKYQPMIVSRSAASNLS